MIYTYSEFLYSRGQESEEEESKGQLKSQSHLLEIKFFAKLGCHARRIHLPETCLKIEP
jgi:hypothetical protein